MRQILFSTQTTSDELEAAGGLTNGGSIVLASHAGETWTLQVEAPDGTWISTAITFTANGIQSALAFERGLRYRLNGGTVGAEAWISENF